LDDVVLALASVMERPGPCDVVWVPRDGLEGRGLSLITSPGNTPVEALKENHVDVQHLDYVRLGVIAWQILEAIRKGNCRHRTPRYVKDRLAQAIREERLDQEHLRPKLRAAVLRRMKTGGR